MRQFFSSVGPSYSIAKTLKLVFKTERKNARRRVFGTQKENSLLKT